MINIIRFEDISAWDKIVTSFNRHDVYYLHGYVDSFRLHGDGVPILIYYESESLRGIYVAMKRDLSLLKCAVGKIQPGQWYDLTTPYGYGGWLLEGDTNENTLRQFYSEYMNCMYENSFVCNFVRYSPVLKNMDPLRVLGNVIDLGKTISIDLSSEELIWQNITSKNRNMIRKAIKNNVQIEHCKPTRALMDTFKVIYDEAMVADNANNYYFFSELFYRSIIDNLSDNAEIFYALHDGEIIAMSIMLHCNGLMHYHLSGTKSQFRQLAPTNLLIYEAALWGCKNGLKLFHLGGGVGSGEDSLFRFKAAFNRNSDFQFSIGQEIFNDKMYQQLVEWRRDYDTSFNNSSSFFPIYRQIMNKIIAQPADDILKTQKIAIYGAGGLGREVAGGIRRINNNTKDMKWELAGFYDDRLEPGTQVSHYGVVLGGMAELNSLKEPLALAIAVGNPSTRKLLFERITNPNISFPNLIAPSFKILDPETFKIGRGNIIQDNCSATCDVTIGDFNVLNGSDILGHDDNIGNFNVIMPGVHLSGEVKIGECNLLGVNSVVLQQIKIGDNVTLGAGSVLMTKPKDGYTYIGTPAKKFDYK